MRFRPLLLIAIWIVTLSAIANGSEASTSINDVFRTEQVLIIAQHDQNRLTERIDSTQTCPKIMSQPTSKVDTNPKEYFPDLKYHTVGVHLVRDPTGDFPPRLLVIREQKNRFNLELVDLNETSVFKDKATPTPEKSFDSSIFSIPYRNHFREKPDQVKSQSIYDTASKFLYVFHPENESYHVSRYFLRGSDTKDSFYLQRLENDTPKSANITNKHRFGWVEDPYAGTVYYKEIVDDETLLFKGPISDFIHFIYCRKSGSFVSKVSPKQHIQGISQGVIYGINEEENNSTVKSQSFVTSYSSQLEVTCEITTSEKDMPVNNKLLIVQSYDYCMMRDRSNYSKTSCEAEQAQYIEDHFGKSEPFNAVLWLTIFSLFLVIIVTLQYVYIYWLRSTFVSADERDMRNENETEASIFIAKQRSFPTSYQDPALLDMSVDKWN